MPEASLIFDYYVTADENTTYQILLSPRFNCHKHVVLDRQPGFAPMGRDNNAVVNIRKKKINSMQLIVYTKKPAVVYIPNAYDKNWKAYHTEDQDKTYKVIKANNLFMAIAVPAGFHQIHFEYKPGSYIIGRIVSILALAVVLLLLLKNTLAKALKKAKKKT